MNLFKRSTFWIWLCVAFGAAQVGTDITGHRMFWMILTAINFPISLIALSLAIRDYRRARAELKAAQAENVRAKLRIREAINKSLTFRRN